jgi:hypothetical protein
VLWGNRLCGIVSGGSIDDRTYVSSLLPLALMEYEYPDLGALGPKARFGDVLDRGVIRASDWNLVRSRIFKDHDDDGKPFVMIRPQD